MKPFEHFMSQMMESARRAQAHDPAGATGIIQKALAQAGLLAPQQAGPAQERPDFIDLNPPPAWSRPAARPKPAARAAPGLPGSFIAGNYSCEAGSRRYKLYIPAKPAPAPRPLIVMLHGCTQNPDDFALGTGMNALAEEAGCLVLYPEQDIKANRTHCWNWFEPGHQARDAGEPGIIAGMTRQIAREHGADPGRIFVAGMSAGGAMTAVMGAGYPELYAAVGVHSGLAAGSARDMITGLQAMKKPGRARQLRESAPIIVFHGDADHVVSPANGEAVLAQFVGAHAGLRAAPLQASHAESTQGGRRCTRAAWRDEAGRSVAEHWIVHGAGHTWSGGNPSGSHTDAQGPCASKEMLRFFLEASR